MAKAKQIVCDEPGSDPREWLAEVIKIRFVEVINHGAAAFSANDIKSIHDMRVATRRLRSVLRDFEGIFDKLPIKRARKDLKALADLLGSVRDQDVAIIALGEFSAETENERIKTGIEQLIGEHRELRMRAHLDLSKAFSIESVEDLRESFKAAIDAADTETDLFRPATVETAGREVIAARLDELSGLGKSIYDPYDNKALHKLRIAAKRLRYAIELFAACFGDAVVPFAEEVAKLQSHLGEVHDCDVWIENLSKRLKRNTRKTAASDEAAAWLLSEFVRKRSKEYRSSLELWTAWKSNDFADRLKANISKH